MATPSKPSSGKRVVRTGASVAAKPAVEAPVPAPVVVENVVAEVPVAPEPTLAEPIASAPVAAPVPEASPVEQKPEVADPIATDVMKGNEIMTDAIETAKTYAEDAKTRIQGAVNEINEKARTAVEKSTKAIEEISEIAKGNLEAIVESSKIAAKGVEALGQDAAEYGRKSFEKTSATLKSFASVKSPTEFFQLQSELLTSTFDTLASETAKSSEAVLKLAGDIAKPISTRVAVVSEKVKSFAA